MGPLLSRARWIDAWRSIAAGKPVNAGRDAAVRAVRAGDFTAFIEQGHQHQKGSCRQNLCGALTRMAMKAYFAEVPCFLEQNDDNIIAATGPWNCQAQSPGRGFPRRRRQPSFSADFPAPRICAMVAAPHVDRPPCIPHPHSRAPSTARRLCVHRRSDGVDPMAHL